MGTVLLVFAVIAVVVLVVVLMVGRRAAVHRADLTAHPDDELEEAQRRAGPPTQT